MQSDHREEEEGYSEITVDNKSLFYKKSQKVSYKMFKELFACEENDRSKKQIKKDYRSLEKSHRQVKFKHLIGMYDPSFIFKFKLLHRLLSHIKRRVWLGLTVH